MRCFSKSKQNLQIVFLAVLSLVFEGQTTLDSVREEIRPFMKNEIEHEMQESALRKAAAEIPSFMPKSKS